MSKSLKKRPPNCLKPRSITYFKQTGSATILGTADCGNLAGFLIGEYKSRTRVATCHLMVFLLSLREFWTYGAEILAPCLIYDPRPESYQTKKLARNFYIYKMNPGRTGRRKGKTYSIGTQGMLLWYISFCHI